jgi:hypothetical protein
MVVRLFLFIAVSSLVTGCASTAPSVGGRLSWEGQDPYKPIHKPKLLAKPSPSVPDPNAEREKLLATVPLYSAAWVVLHNQIEAEEDRRLKNKLLICRGCFAKADQDSTGSLHP